MNRQRWVAVGVLGAAIVCGAEGAGGPCSPCDYVADGVLDCYDFRAFTLAYEAGAPGGDFNMDGVVNAQDFFDFLGCFFASSPPCITPAAPPNNECAAATPIGGTGVFPFDCCSATGSSALPAGCSSSEAGGISADVWFCWTSPVGGEICISTIGLTTIDSVLVVYDGCAPCPVAADIIGCNDDAIGLQSLVSFVAVAGDTYLVQVGVHTPRDNIFAFPGSGAIRVTSDVLCPCDFNRYGGLDSVDFFAYIVAFFALDPSAEFDGIPGITSGDFFTFLVCFLAPPPAC